jgi:hypothetical protein
MNWKLLTKIIEDLPTLLGRASCERLHDFSARISHGASSSPGGLIAEAGNFLHPCAKRRCARQPAFGGFCPAALALKWLAWLLCAAAPRQPVKSNLQLETFSLRNWLTQ